MPRRKRKHPLALETNHPDLLPQVILLMQVSSAVLLYAILFCKTKMASVNETRGRFLSFTFDRDSDSCQATKTQRSLCENVSI